MAAAISMKCVSVAQWPVSKKGFRPEQVRHQGGGGVVPPERTQVEDGLNSRTERIVGILDPSASRPQRNLT
jgi:hypothetical protein